MQTLLRCGIYGAGSAQSLFGAEVRRGHEAAAALFAHGRLLITLRWKVAIMKNLERIKQHVDAHGVGCVVVKDHVAISIAWRSESVNGEERRMETTRRASSLKEACSIVGCRCLDAGCEACEDNAA